jgi:hypothetical protein
MGEVGYRLILVSVRVPLHAIGEKEQECAKNRDEKEDGVHFIKVFRMMSTRSSMVSLLVCLMRKSLSTFTVSRWTDMYVPYGL